MGITTTTIKRKEPTMRKSKQSRKQSAIEQFKSRIPQSTFLLAKVIKDGKCALDSAVNQMGRTFVEFLMEAEREMVVGLPYHPKDPDTRRWARQNGSVFIGDGKMKVSVPRIRRSGKEVPLSLYNRLHSSHDFSEEMLSLALRGLAAGRYEETVKDLGDYFGISRSSCSRKLVQATTGKLKEFLERNLGNIEPFAIFLDGIRRGKAVFIVSVCIDTSGRKKFLGFWEGSTENSDVCNMLLQDIERRGLSLHPAILFVTDGGAGICKSLREKFGKTLFHQRCTIHKKRNIENHLPKHLRREAAARLDQALGCVSYADAKKELKKVLKWLEQVHVSAASSLQEGFDELITVQKLGIPKSLRKSLCTTNVIDSAFASVRRGEKNIQRYRSGRMTQRWLASVLLHCESRFQRVFGYREIPKVMSNIEKMVNKVAAKKKVA
jgi:transposase-like protein